MAILEILPPEDLFARKYAQDLIGSETSKHFHLPAFKPALLEHTEIKLAPTGIASPNVMAPITD
jgi:hypothetical protein